MDTKATDRNRSDGELVHACAAGDLDEAFAEVVRRHGRVVYAVCRGLLGNEADAEDAFQATFLVFLRRANEVKQPSAIAGWLGGVAARVARRTRQIRTRHREREKALAMSMANESTQPTGPTDPAIAALSTEERSVVWQEIAALPDKYRDVVLLCHLEDRTTDEAAEALGCPVGTVRSRLLKARELLRTRLVKRGLVPVSAVALLILADEQARAAPPAALIARTTAAAQGSASPGVTQLVKEATRSPGAQYRWLGVSAGIVTLLIMAAIKLSLGRPAAPPETPPPPSTVGQSSTTGTLLAVSQIDAKVFLLDPATGRVRATVSTDPCPHEVAVSPDGRRAATACYGLPYGQVFGRSVIIFDVRTGEKLHTVNVGPGSGPHGLRWLDNRRLLCTAEQKEGVVEIDADRGEVARTLRTAQVGTHMVVATDRQAFTTNAISGTVTSLDLAEGVKIRDQAVMPGHEGIALSPDGKDLWIANRAAESVTMLSTVDLAVVRTVRLPGGPLRITYTPDGKTIAVTLIESGEIAFLDATSGTETRRLKLNAGPITFDTIGPVPGPTVLVFTPDGATAYCSVFISKAVAVIDVASGQVTRKFDLPGQGIDGLALSPVGE